MPEPWTATWDPDKRCPVSADFDTFKDEFQNDAGMSMQTARRDYPIFFSTVLDGYAITRYRDIETVLKQPLLFSARDAKKMISPMCPAAVAKLEEHGYEPVTDLTIMDEPRHMQLRKRLGEPFKLDAVKEFEPVVRGRVTECIDQFIDDGRADLADVLIWKMPGQVASDFSGIPESEAGAIREYSSGLFRFLYGRQSEEEQVHDAEVVARLEESARRAMKILMEDSSGGGVLPHAFREYREDPTDFDENFLLGTVIQGQTAAHETTAHALSNAIRRLLSEPGIWAEICSDPSLIPNCVDECLRTGPTFAIWRRQVLEDTTLGDVPMPAGSLVNLILASGNHDEEVFPEPERFDIHRPNARRHLTFGRGAHHCLGQYLARQELRVALEELTRRLPHMRLVEGQTYRTAEIAAVGGPISLEVEWDIGENPSPGGGGGAGRRNRLIPD